MKIKLVAVSGLLAAAVVLSSPGHAVRLEKTEECMPTCNCDYDELTAAQT